MFPHTKKVSSFINACYGCSLIEWRLWKDFSGCLLGETVLKARCFGSKYPTGLMQTRLLVVVPRQGWWQTQEKAPPGTVYCTVPHHQWRSTQHKKTRAPARIRIPSILQLPCYQIPDCNFIDFKYSLSRDESEVKILNILVVDDSPPILKMTTMLLRKNGHIVTTCEDGYVYLSLYLMSVYTLIK